MTLSNVILLFMYVVSPLTNALSRSLGGWWLGPIIVFYFLVLKYSKFKVEGMSMKLSLSRERNIEIAS